jgi:hypothetical protein
MDRDVIWPDLSDDSFDGTDSLFKQAAQLNQSPGESLSSGSHFPAPAGFILY